MRLVGMNPINFVVITWQSLGLRCIVLGWILIYRNSSITVMIMFVFVQQLLLVGSLNLSLKWVLFNEHLNTSFKPVPAFYSAFKISSDTKLVCVLLCRMSFFVITAFIVHVKIVLVVNDWSKLLRGWRVVRVCWHCLCCVSIYWCWVIFWWQLSWSNQHLPCQK